MNYRGFHLPAAFLVFILVIAGGLLGKHVYERTQVMTPLEDKLEEASGVQRVVFQRGPGGKTVVYLELDPAVTLSSAFSQVREIAASSRADLAIYVVDSASQELLHLFERVRIAAEEAIITGQFTLLEERVRDLALAQGVTWELSVDRDYIYVSLADGESVLRRVISRAPHGGDLEVYAGGGAAPWRNG
ncbi:hypothetical protein [Candidatus Darwinibacter acetoxidans]